MRYNTLLALVVPALLVTGCGRKPPVAEPAPAPVSGLIKANFDPKLRPQDDLFRAVNGAWLAKTEIPADKSSYGAFDIVADQAEQELRGIVEDAATAKDNAAGSEAQKIGDLYLSFMDEPRADELGFKPLAEEFARIDALKSKSELPALIAHLHRIGVEAPYDAVVHQDAHDATQYIVDYVQSGLGMPDRDYYLSTDKTFVDLRQKYVAHVEKMLSLAGVSDAARRARDVMEFETQLAAKQWTKVDARDADKTYNKLDRAALKKLTLGYDWDAYFSEAGVKADAVVVSEPSYLHGFGILYWHTPLNVFKSYLKQRLLDAYAPYLSADFVAENFAFNKRALRGIQEQRPRWKRGVALVDNAIGEAAGKLYVAKYFPPANKARMQALVQNLLNAYGQEFDSLDWMSEDTRHAAKAKLATFMTKIGYPDKWRDYSTLDIRKDDLVGNVMRANAFEYQRNIGKLGQPVDRSEWGMTPQTVNAYYNPELNEIVFPAAILRPPFFDMTADDAVNYGSIGAVIGHEISHGFDDQGSKYDGAGNLKDWWTADDRRKFEEKTKALVEQYNQYEPVKGMKLNGALTLGENIADLGGLVIAHKAYTLSLAGKPAPVIDGYTGDQRFFLGYAQAWMEKDRDESLISLIKSDPHSPPEFRANGTPVNVPAFFDAFGIKPGDGMYKAPEARIRIW
ncbi:MAG: M13 family peptidase [Nevskiaceae bacterium]|nr:MAG: M13 family peptidase [Nevskiaceae bacterium]